MAADLALQDALLTEVIKPFLRANAKGAPVPSRAFFLRERRDATSTLRLWSSAAAESMDALARSLRSAGHAGGKPLEVEVLPGSSLNAVDGPYAGPQAAALLADMLADASSLLLDRIAAVAGGKVPRTTVALDIMVAHLPAIDIARAFPDRYPLAKRAPGFPAAFGVYRSHADGFFIMSTDPASARARLDAQYEGASAAIRSRVAGVLSQFADGPIVSEVGASWHDLARTYLHRAEAAIRSGALTITWSEGYLGDMHDLMISPFHQIAQNDLALRALLRSDCGYQAARFAMSGLYLTLTGLGIRLIDRYFLCHAISRACEELFGLDATTVVRELARALSPGPPAVADSSNAP